MKIFYKVFLLFALFLSHNTFAAVHYWYIDSLTSPTIYGHGATTTEAYNNAAAGGHTPLQSNNFGDVTINGILYYGVDTQTWTEGGSGYKVQGTDAPFCNGLTQDPFDVNTMSWTAGNCYVPPPPICTDGDILQQGYFPLGTDPNTIIETTACYSECFGIFTGSEVQEILNGVINYYAAGEYTADGTNCTTAEGATALAELPAFSCGPGQTPVTIGNNFLCEDDITGDTVGIIKDGDETVATNEQTTETVTSVTNPDNSVTVTTTTTYPDGSTLIKEVITQPDGTQAITIDQTGTESTGGLLNEYCQTNPNAAICGGTIYGDATNCDVAPTCTGDAVQCAIAVNSWRSYCELNALTENEPAPYTGTQSGDYTIITDSIGLTEAITNVGDETGITAPLLTVPSLTLGGGGICQVQTGTLRGVGFTIDTCPTIEIIRGALYWFFAMMTIFFIISYWSELNRGSA